jgi:uncharacterized membrane protein YdbT with pleckstrin-like domain
MAEPVIAHLGSGEAGDDRHSMQETTLLQTNPAMFRESPMLFIVCVLGIPVGLGLLALGIWWVATKAALLTITDKRTIVRRGLLSKNTNEVLHRDIRNIRVSQTFLQRVFGAGRIEISSSGQGDIEIRFDGVKDPDAVKAMIDRYREL